MFSTSLPTVELGGDRGAGIQAITRPDGLVIRALTAVKGAEAGLGGRRASAPPSSASPGARQRLAKSEFAAIGELNDGEPCPGNVDDARNGVAVGHRRGPEHGE
jgi:hypothetical protein